MSHNPLHDELAYLKGLAEEGGIGPVRNGASLVSAGIVYGLAAVAHYLAIKGFLPLTAWTPAIIWFGASVIFAAVSIAFHSRRAPGETSVAARASTAAWSGVGIAIMVFILTLIVIANVLKDFSAVSFLIAPVVLILYGIGWWVGGAIANRRWVKMTAFGSFLAAPVITLLAGRAEELLAYAVCLILFTTVPGIILLRADKV